MKQYLELLRTIKEKGTYKPPARTGMPGSQSLFGYQFRHNLADGFPLLTTKKMFWKGVVVELLWFLRGDTNIKYLIDNGCNIWNEDAFNYYKKKMLVSEPAALLMSMENFLINVKEEKRSEYIPDYTYGDCGYQYGKVWRNWEGVAWEEKDRQIKDSVHTRYDQIKNVINSLKNNPESRRHIVTAIDPAHSDDLALYPCHALFQFNCRNLTEMDRHELNGSMYDDWNGKSPDENNVPKYYLDCQLYQRSADVFLGVPFNIASYALLIHIIAKICNMIPGEFIHTFGDVHIYDNHKKAVEEQLKRTPDKLPTLKIPNIICDDLGYLNETIHCLNHTNFKLENYNPQPAIKAELSTGLQNTRT